MEVLVRTISLTLVFVLFTIGCKANPADKNKNNGLPLSLSMNMYVSTKNGIKIREQPTLDSNVLKVLPYGAMLILHEAQSTEINIDDKNGFWVRVAWYDLRGWVFSGDLKINPDYEIFKHHEIGGFLNGDLPFILYEKPDILSRRIADSVDNVQIESIKIEIEKVKYIPIRWAEVTARTSTGKQKGWIYSSQLVTGDESISNSETVDKKIIKTVIDDANAKICELNVIGEIRIITLNPKTNSGSSCSGYGESRCINIISKNGKVIYTDFKNKSIGYLEKVNNEYAFFYIQAGEGRPCGGFFKKYTTVININTLEIYRIESYNETSCLRCIKKDDKEVCLNDKYKQSEEVKYFNSKNELIKKEEVPIEILSEL